MILAIDPSFSSTGVAITDDIGTPVLTRKLEHPGKCYDSITSNHEACQEICDEITHLIEEEGYLKLHVIIEYPALNTFSGGYLGILHGYLSCVLNKSSLVEDITWVGPKHCDSFISNKTHSKTFIVNWCKKKGLIKKRTSHDECTALVLAQLWVAINKGLWKKSYFVE